MLLSGAYWAGPLVLLVVVAWVEVRLEKVQARADLAPTCFAAVTTAAVTAGVTDYLALPV